MDYINNVLDQEIEIKRIISQDQFELSQLLRIKIEYYLLLILGYLWNKNFNKLSDEDARQYIIKTIIKPSLGSIVDVCRKLDLGKEIFNDKKLIPNFFNYTELRNNTLGHGYLLSAKLPDYISELEKHIQQIEKSKIEFLSSDFELIRVDSIKDNNYGCVSYNDKSIKPSLIPTAIADLKIDNLYITRDSNYYHCVSPFIYVSKQNEFFLFNSVEEKLTGRVKLNCINQTKSTNIIWREFTSYWEISYGLKKISGNGTIINIFNNNYANYISIGTTKKSIDKFLDNKSSVVATIWGHGGVGKTATIQSICQDLSLSEEKKFEYILFLSAKDRFYNYYLGEIEVIDDVNRIDNYEHLIESINEIIFDERTFDEERIITLDSKCLIIIDDFETFSSEDRIKIENFIDRLNINCHKVIITTRISSLKIGSEIKTLELTIDETEKYAIESIKNHFPSANIKNIENDIEQYIASIFNLTSGRPLFISQFINYWMRVGDINRAINTDIKNQKNAIDFLYGRIYDSLSRVAKDIFDTISVLVNTNDLTNLIDKLKYILNKEKDEETFNEGIDQLNDLLIIRIENGFFTVLSKEIYEMMQKSFNDRGDVFIRFIKDRLNQVGRSKELDTDIALLKTADSYRTSRTETEVESIYRQILNRSTDKKDIQLKALLNLSDYWFNYRGRKDIAITTLEEYELKFASESQFIKMFSSYLWANGNRNRACKVLLSYFDSKPDFKREINVELLGQLVIYQSIAIVDDRERLKSNKNLEQISQADFSSQYKKQKNAMYDIYNFHGKKLFEIAKKCDIDKVMPGTRQNIALGLYQIIDICSRINKYNEASEICTFAIKSLPANFKKQFLRAQNRIHRFNN